MIKDEDLHLGSKNVGVAQGHHINQDITVINLGPLPNYPEAELRSPIADQEVVKGLVRMLADHNSFSHNVHRPLESGLHVTDYIDLRILAQDTKIGTAFAKAVGMLVDPVEIDIIIGLDQIGLAISRSLSNLIGKPCSYFLTSSSKPRMIENEIPKSFGTRVLLVCDVVATGDTVHTAIGRLQRNGFTVPHTVAMVVRWGKDQPASKELSTKFQWILSYPFQNYEMKKCPACQEGKGFY